MKIAVDHVLKGLDGRAFDTAGSGGEPHTVKTICVQALMSPGPQSNAELDGATSFKRGVLAEKIHNAEGEVSLTAEEVGEIKALAGKIYLPALILPLYRALEGEIDGG